jgi:hypothetical protein
MDVNNLRAGGPSWILSICVPTRRVTSASVGTTLAIDGRSNGGRELSLGAAHQPWLRNHAGANGDQRQDSEHSEQVHFSAKSSRTQIDGERWASARRHAAIIDPKRAERGARVWNITPARHGYSKCRVRGWVALRPVGSWANFEVVLNRPRRGDYVIAIAPGLPDGHLPAIYPLGLKWDLWP